MAFLTNKGLFWTKSDVFCTMQLIRNISMDNEQYIQRALTWKSTGKINGWFCHTSQKELEKRTIWFLKMEKKHNLCFKISKCNFDTREIPILEVVVRWGEVLIENNKTKTVKEWKTPINVKEVESFLEFANFYRCFIKNFSHIVKPLNELKGKKDWK